MEENISSVETNALSWTLFQFVYVLRVYLSPKSLSSLLITFQELVTINASYLWVPS